MLRSNSPVLGIAIIAALVVISRLVRRGRLQSRSTTLAPRERIRPLAITMIDPFISLLVIGGLVIRLVPQSPTHVVSAVVGALVGIVVGYARALVMFVRAITSTRSVVLRRSGIEYGLLAVLIALRSFEGSIEHSSSLLSTSVLTGLATLALCEAFARSGFIVLRYLGNAPAPAYDEGDESL